MHIDKSSSTLVFQLLSVEESKGLHIYIPEPTSSYREKNHPVYNSGLLNIIHSSERTKK